MWWGGNKKRTPLKTSGSLRQFAIPTKGILFILFFGLNKKKKMKERNVNRRVTQFQTPQNIKETNTHTHTLTPLCFCLSPLFYLLRKSLCFFYSISFFRMFLFSFYWFFLFTLSRDFFLTWMLIVQVKKKIFSWMSITFFCSFINKQLLTDVNFYPKIIK